MARLLPYLDDSLRDPRPERAGRGFTTGRVGRQYQFGAGAAAHPRRVTSDCGTTTAGAHRADVDVRVEASRRPRDRCLAASRSSLPWQ